MSEEKWPGPKGLIPVTDGREDDANVHNRRYLDHMLVEMRVIDSVKPDLHTKIFGRTYDTPLMMPAFSHLNKVGENGRMPMEEYALAAKQLHMLNWVGMESDETFARIMETGADTVRIIKPFADHDTILEQIDFACDQGAVAVGVDIDHIAGKDGGYDVVDGMPLGPVYFADLKEYCQHSAVPFVAKGVLSVTDAVKAREAGCAAIVVSHHHGRIPCGMPPAAMLKDIKKALAGSGVTIFCDCGLASGYDCYKTLALGADAVSLGRVILKPLLQEGADGVIRTVRQLNNELSEMMMYTCVPDTSSFDDSVLYEKQL